ncbi:MAG: transposase, partial [Bacilli bacterium]|nr:transposase [Bacilli bacterium]
MNLSKFLTTNFYEALESFFNDLKVPVSKIASEPADAKDIISNNYKSENEAHKLINKVYFLGMVNEQAFDGTENNESLETVKALKEDYDGILIFGIELNSRRDGLLPTRSQLAEISRAFNREFNYTPVTIVFKYGKMLAFANSERLKYKQEWREGEKVGKVSLLRDINVEVPHSGHLRILQELEIPRTGKNAVDSFEKLYKYWQEVFSVSLLNKKFYKELSNWYFWAIKHVVFPNRPTAAIAHEKGIELDELIREHNATNVIRLLTRILFVWFIKEKRLIPEELFDINSLQTDILKEISPYHDTDGIFATANKESVYYKAILQNLFFASLNCPIKADDVDARTRGFRLKNHYGQDRGNDWRYRYENYFKNPDVFLEMMNKTVPFLNGGLFECLDEKLNNVYIDGFSDQMTKGELLIVPDYLFFGTESTDDISEITGIKDGQNKNADVKGLINILKSYKFTITENTPIEEDIELDPELLGKVFENLLASYNPETKTTARKQTGSFYTPREIVNYMVDESLIAYLTNVLEASSFENATNLEKNNVLEASSFEKSNIQNPTKFEKNNEYTSDYPFFNPLDEIEIHEGRLPHWKQKDVFYHVTFRLADSIPRQHAEQLRTDRENWKKKHKDKKEFTKNEWKEYNRLFHARVEEWLNAGYGSCLLWKKENASIVANALKHFDGERYILDEWVVMPNHVHVLVKPFAKNNLSDILHSWKSFTANEINKREGKTGQLWMHESYDHIVRNEDALKAIRYYIRMNPAKAKINVPEASSLEKNNVLNASSFEKNNILEASSFEKSTQSKDALGTMLHQLISYSSLNPFADDKDATRIIINALDNCKILDPACGSGAF